MTIGEPRPTGLEFDRVAERYDQARPDYPPELFGELVALVGIGPGSRVLEVGSGTGKATVPLARMGCQVTCLEPGGDLTAIAAAKLGPGADVRFVPARFEDWEPGPLRFDLVCAATSWHWIDPAERYRKAAAVLAPGGALAFWAAMHGFPEGYDPFFDEIQPAYDAISTPQQPAAITLPPAEVPDLAPEIDASCLFGPVTVRRFLWATEYTAEAYIELISTFSAHLIAGPERDEQLFARIRELIGQRPGGSITRHWLAMLHVARLRAGQPGRARRAGRCG